MSVYCCIGKHWLCPWKSPGSEIQCPKYVIIKNTDKMWQSIILSSWPEKRVYFSVYNDCLIPIGHHTVICYYWMYYIHNLWWSGIILSCINNAGTKTTENYQKATSLSACRKIWCLCNFVEKLLKEIIDALTKVNKLIATDITLSIYLC